MLIRRLPLAALVVSVAVISTFAAAQSTAAPPTFPDVAAATPGSTVTVPANTSTTPYPAQTFTNLNKCDAAGNPTWVVAADFASTYVHSITVNNSACLRFSGFTLIGWQAHGFRVGMTSSNVALLYSIVDGSAGVNCDPNDTGKAVHVNSTPSAAQGGPMNKALWSSDIAVVYSTIRNAPVDLVAIYGAKGVTIASNTLASPMTNVGTSSSGTTCDASTEHNDMIQMQRVEGVTIDSNTMTEDPARGPSSGPDQAVIASDGTTGYTETGLVIINNTLHGWKRGIPMNFAGSGVVIDRLEGNAISCSNPTSTGNGIKPNSGATVLSSSGNTFSSTC